MENNKNRGQSACLIGWRATWIELYIISSPAAHARIILIYAVQPIIGQILNLFFKNY
jgi:hypothetical protein